MIKNIVFDLGKVLVDFEPALGMKKMGFTDEEVSLFVNNIFSELWEYCDKFPYEDDEIRGIFKERVPGYEKQVDILWDNLTMLTGARPYAKEWLIDLKHRGYKLYVLSNYGKNSFAINSKVYDFLEYFDGLVLSYEEVMVKPEPEIYYRLLEKFDLKAEECIFIDDRQVNVNASIACGIDALLFTSYEETSKRLDSILLI